MISVEVGLFKNYIEAYPSEMDRVFASVKYIIEEGIGGDMLDKITRKSFRDSNEDYIIRLRKELNTHDEGWEALYYALFKWYESWNHSYKNIRDENLYNKYKEKPLHTWLYCLLTGKSEVFRSITNEEVVTVEKTTWEEIIKKSKIKNKESFGKGEVQKISSDSERITRLMDLYFRDEDIQVKELIFNKKIAIFNESKWNEKQIEKVITTYHLAAVNQFSSLNMITGQIGNFDFYIFITTQAKHSVKYTLESKVPKDKVFLIHNNNEERVMDEWIKQLRGKIKTNDK